MTDSARSRQVLDGGAPRVVYAVRGGAPLDFDRLFEAELDYVWHSLRRLGVREADLDDEVNEVFLRVHRQLSNYDPARPLRPWLFAFAARVAAEHRRRAHVRREVPGLPLDVEDDAPNTEALAAEAEMRMLVLRALEALDQPKREVLVAIDIDGHSGPELADALGVSVNTVYSRLRLAREEFTTSMRRLRKDGAP
jgi:RNA polymerase sigma-70 factor (ECF subfamily)